MLPTAWEAIESSGPDDVSDEELVARFQAGDISAFCMLVQRHANQLHKFLVDRVGQDDADDLLQDIFLKVYQKLLCLQEELRCFKAWLYRVASNTATDHHRRSHQVQWLPWKEHEEFYEDRHRFVPGPEQRVEEAEFLSEVMAHVSPQYRVCIYLDIFEDMRQREISNFLDISERTVRRYISEGKKQLFKAYEHLIQQEP